MIVVPAVKIDEENDVEDERDDNESEDEEDNNGDSNCNEVGVVVVLIGLMLL